MINCFQWNVQPTFVLNQKRLTNNLHKLIQKIFSFVEKFVKLNNKYKVNRRLFYINVQSIWALGLAHYLNKYINVAKRGTVWSPLLESSSAHFRSSQDEPYSSIPCRISSIFRMIVIYFLIFLQRIMGETICIYTFQW